MDRKNLNLGNDVNALHIFLEQDVALLPIPKVSAFSGFMSLTIAISNSSDAPQNFCFSRLLPELLDASMQSIRCKVNPPKESDHYYLNTISPSSYSTGRIAFEDLRLIWRENKLNLEFWSLLGDRKLRAMFANIQPGEYLLKFRYCIPFGSKWKSTSLETQFIILRVLEQSEELVEVEGLQFEVSVPERVAIPPLKHLEKSSPIEFCFQVHNSSSRPHLLLLFGLMPQLQDSSGKMLNRSYARDLSCHPEIDNFHFLLPGDRTRLVISGEFLRYRDEVIFGGWENSGGRWSFHDFKAGKYWLGISYQALKPEEISRRYYDNEIWSRYQKIWEGNITTPVKKFEVTTS